ncbi:MAG: DUF2156 domain-containing protein [Clostridia bacterium]|nr:DUF2156 domain-containing protein [Clostridia bacterium]
MNTQTLLDFKPVTAADRAAYDERLFRSSERGSEFSFANLYFWGEQSLCPFEDGYLIFARFGGRSMYYFPLVDACHERAAIDATLADAAARGIPYCITGMGLDARARMEALYPDRFRYVENDGAHDYVYAIDDLADLLGKKYDGKRNHVHRFEAEHPAYIVEPIRKDNLGAVREMAASWYRARLEKDPDADFQSEERALYRALDDFDALALEGILLSDGDAVLAFTVASRLAADTFDVHFEKARADVTGAYAVINYRFARYLREKYPAVRYLNREEDMGIAGLRRAKQSYHPHHLARKCWALPKESCDEK